MGKPVWYSSNPRNVDTGHSRVEYAEYIRHLRKDLGIDVSHFHKNVGTMADGYLKGVADVDSRLRAILNSKLGAPGFS